MKRYRETEIKLRVISPRRIKRRLRQCGFLPVIERHVERNVLLDLPDRWLTRAGRLLRLRQARGEAVLTFKGAPQQSTKYKVRCEIETRVADGETFAAILLSSGFQKIFRYEKFRTVYRQSPVTSGAGTLMYDETPIGHYLELEGRRTWIDRTARQLGFEPAAYITTSYGGLYQEYRRRRGPQVGKPGEMVFATRKHRLRRAPRRVV